MQKKWKLLQIFNKVFFYKTLIKKKSLVYIYKKFLFSKNKNLLYFLQIKKFKLIFILYFFSLAIIEFYEENDISFYLVSKLKFWILLDKNLMSIISWSMASLFLLYYQKYWKLKKNTHTIFLESFLVFIKIYTLIKNISKNFCLSKVNSCIIDTLILSKFLLTTSKSKKDCQCTYIPLFLIVSLIELIISLNFFKFFTSLLLKKFINLIWIKVLQLLIVKMFGFLILFFIKIYSHLIIHLKKKNLFSIKIFMNIKTFFKFKLVFYDENYSFYKNFSLLI